MKQFFEFKGLENVALVTKVEELTEKTLTPGKQRFTITADVADFVRMVAIGNLKAPDLKSCKFQLSRGQFISFDTKGQPTITNIVPDWAMNESDYAREQWLVNKGYAEKSGVVLVEDLMAMNLKDRRKLCDILLNLELDKISARPGRTGNTNGKSTKPKVMDLGSFEYFMKFYDRLKETVTAVRFPTLNALTGLDDVSKAPTNLKQACRTYFKAITSELPPNNKVVERGNPEIMTAKIRAILEEVERVGLENYYKQLAQAIQEAQEANTTIADFKFRYTED